MKKIYLTIDDAPSEKMDILLDYLIENKIKAAFFCQGNLVEKRPEPVLRAIKSGFVIGNHGYSHTRFSELSLKEGIEEIKKTDRLILKLHKQAGVKWNYKYFRFPYLDAVSDNRIQYQKLLYKLKYVPYFNGQKYVMDWGSTFDTKDYERPSAQELIRGVTQIKDKAVMLMHDLPYSINLLFPQLCAQIKNLGFRFDDLRSHHDNGAVKDKLLLHILMKISWMKFVKRDYRFFDYVVKRNFNKVLLRVRGLPKSPKEDIAVVIAVKNRCNYRLINALKSIRTQDYNQSLIKIIIVDYGSEQKYVNKYVKMCKKYDADYTRVDKNLAWNRAHALNIGIKKAKTKYLLTSDVDIVFESNYIRTAIKELKKNPFQVILSNALDSKEEDFPGEIDISEKYDHIKARSKIRKGFGPGICGLGAGINLAPSYFYRKIKGYDENYGVWGSEDMDLIKRFEFFGLDVKDISRESSYVHQWHPAYGGAKCQDYETRIAENQSYYYTINSIVRNKNGWGQL